MCLNQEGHCIGVPQPGRTLYRCTSTWKDTATLHLNQEGHYLNQDGHCIVVPQPGRTLHWCSATRESTTLVYLNQGGHRISVPQPGRTLNWAEPAPSNHLQLLSAYGSRPSWTARQQQNQPQQTHRPASWVTFACSHTNINCNCVTTALEHSIND